MKVAGLFGLAVSVPAVRLCIDVESGVPGLFNDYHHYWLAGRIVAAGGDPYRTDSLLDMAQREGLTFLVGSGYSYPPPFAVVMKPLARLPFQTSAAVFAVVSVVVFGLAVAMLVRAMPRAPALALAAGAYPPVAGSLFVGQANLLVFGLLAVGFAQLERRSVLGAVAWGSAAVVKLVPLALLVPLGLARKWTVALAFVASAAGWLAASALAAPQTFGGVSAMRALLEPDTYWANQSLNGVISRLLAPTALAGQTSILVVVATLLFGALTLWIVWGAGARLLDARHLLLAEAFVLVAATLGGAKNSFWNHTPTLLAAWALLLVGGPRMGRSRCLLWVWFIAAWIQPRENVTGEASVLLSSGFFSVLALWLLLARTLLAPDPQFAAASAKMC